jgi:histidinol-phosphate phosphatase family protein
VRDQGMRRILLLTGYRGEVIKEYFGKGERVGVEIAYSCGPAEWDTGRRLWEARGQMEPKFILLYSDNFIQFNLTRLVRLCQNHETPIGLLLAPKEKGNIRISPTGKIDAYDKSRSGEGFDFVEVGYMLVKRDQMLIEFPNCADFPDFNFSVLIEKYSKEGKLAGLVVRDPYHSISDLKRLNFMCDYLRPKKILLMDRDGTINRKAPEGRYVTNWNEFDWIEDTVEAMKSLASLGFSFIVITNQAGIARKMICQAELDNIHKNMVEQLKAQGVTVLKVYVSPDHWEENSFTRKPAPGLFFQAAKEYSLRMDRCLYVGDDERDCIAASNAGCGMIYFSDGESEPKLDEFPKPYFRTNSLHACVELIQKVYGEWEGTE